MFEDDNCDSSVLDEFNKLKDEVEKLRQEVVAAKADLSENTNKINDDYNKWFKNVDEIVKKINTNFSKYFGELDCAGDISLCVGEDKMNFEEYGIEIKAKYRNEEDLSVVTRDRQSAGERAVTTAVYLFALQDMIKVPFRVVDEINQGMDPVNECKIFELIAKIAKNNNSQYFMITPKLVPNLNYNESVTVLILLNGKFMLPTSKIEYSNVKKILQAIKRRRTVE